MKIKVEMLEDALGETTTALLQTQSIAEHKLGLL